MVGITERPPAPSTKDFVHFSKRLAWPFRNDASSGAARAGEIVTAAGVSAGIDMSLWLVGRIHGRPHARAVRRYIQYDPAPPYLADEPLA